MIIMNKKILSLVLSSLSLLVLISACIRNPATRKVHTRLLSYEAERRIGKDTKKKILEQYPLFDNKKVTDYVAKIGQDIATLSDRPTVDYEFLVLDSDLINAFAAPGGFIFVTRGLLENIQDEAELAMVLGHEVAHVAALHGVQMIQKEMGQNALTVLGTIGAALVAGPEAMIMINKTGTLFSALYLLGYSREKELEADNLGLQYMLRADYDPRGSLRFLNELQKEDDKKLEGWDLYFRTHPNTVERIDIIQHMIGEELIKDKKIHQKEFQAIKALLPKVDERERGKIKKNIYQNKAHELLLTIPDNWSFSQIHPQSLVSFQTQDHKGQGRLQVIVPSSGTHSAEGVALNFAKQRGFHPLNGRDVLYRAGYGYLGRFIGYSPRGRPLDYRMFVTLRRGKGYILLCGAPPEKAESYILDLEQILRGLEFDPT
ncbi:hypothetical protein BVX98_02575 [bacterium F11]|nr:hypothetical protein BVX98_02575 [bacterium F11]